jgi:hypothetical protein
VTEVSSFYGAQHIVSLSSYEDGNRSSSRNVVFSSYLEFGTMDEVHKASDPECYVPSSEAFEFSWRADNSLPVSFTVSA